MTSPNFLKKLPPSAKNKKPNTLKTKQFKQMKMKPVTINIKAIN